MTRVWIPGWQFSKAAFQPLWQALGCRDEPQLTYAGTQLSLEDWLEQKIVELPDECTLIGWSLGGMLAYELAKRSSRVAKVLIIGSNVQFSGGPGLPEAIAENFLARYARSSEVTRKRFASLVDPDHAQEVSGFYAEGDHLNTLKWLYQLKLSGEQSFKSRVLLGRQDQLVPADSAKAAWTLLGSEVALMDGHHSLPITHAHNVADWILSNG